MPQAVGWIQLWDGGARALRRARQSKIYRQEAKDAKELGVGANAALSGLFKALWANLSRQARKKTLATPVYLWVSG